MIGKVQRLNIFFGIKFWIHNDSYANNIIQTNIENADIQFQKSQIIHH